MDTVAVVTGLLTGADGAAQDDAQCRVRRSAFATKRYNQLYRGEHSQHYLSDGRERAGYTTRPPPPPPWTVGAVDHTATVEDGESSAVTAATSADSIAAPALPARPAPAPALSLPVKSGGGVGIRVLQWNINCMNGAGDKHPDVTDVFTEVMRHKADVIVLNEFGSGVYTGVGKVRGRADESSINKLAALLLRGGYALYATSVIFPTVVAVAMTDRVLEHEAISISRNRGAIRVKVNVVRGGQSRTFTVYGTHLDHMHGDTRRAEIEALLADVARHTKSSGPGVPPTVLIAGDFNEQRQVDYDPQDWADICSGKLRRGENRSKVGQVAQSLTAAGFRCCFDDADGPKNWDPRGPPPPTHWSSTVIDFAYTRGGFCDAGVYVSDSNLSDHRPVVTDWMVEE
eukprot:m.167468 g.167468  ORF g.167468 m.167468 type:complete len:400 (-) comp24102_c0_seq9:349-1548(-)